MILYWTNIWQIKLPLHSFALLYSVELSVRGRVLLQTLPDHNYNVKTDITYALHLGCRIYMCSLNIISQFMSHVTSDMHTDVNFKQWYNKYQSTFIFNSYKTISVEERTIKACPNNDCQRHFILEWLGKHLLTVHHISLYVKCHSDNGHRQRQSINSPRTQHRNSRNPRHFMADCQLHRSLSFYAQSVLLHLVWNRSQFYKNNSHTELC